MSSTNSSRFSNISKYLFKYYYSTKKDRYELSNPNLSYFYQLKDPSLVDEFRRFLRKKHSIRFMILSNFIFSLVFVPCAVGVLCNDVLLSHLGDSSFQLTTSSIAAVAAVMSLVLGYYIMWHQVYDIYLQNQPEALATEPHRNTNSSTTPSSGGTTDIPLQVLSSNSKSQSNDCNLENHSHSDTAVPTNNKNLAHHHHIILMQNFLILSVEIYFIFNLIRRSLLPLCTGHQQPYSNNSHIYRLIEGVDGWAYCYQTDTHFDVINYIWSTILIPIFYFTNFPDIDISYVWSCFGCLIVATICIIIAKEDFQMFLEASFWISGGMFVVADVQLRNTAMFYTNRKLVALLEENERMSAEITANELRHMIGNVAHDLKTVRSD